MNHPLLWRGLPLAAVAGVITEPHPVCQSPNRQPNGRFPHTTKSLAHIPRLSAISSRKKTMDNGRFH
jgi:hypothetical protein